MAEFLLVSCSIIIIGFVLTGFFIYYNIQRVLAGKRPQKFREAIQDVFSTINKSFKDFFTSQKKKTKTKKKKEYIDAEFREVK